MLHCIAAPVIARAHLVLAMLAMGRFCRPSHPRRPHSFIFHLPTMSIMRDLWCAYSERLVWLALAVLAMRREASPCAPHTSTALIYNAIHVGRRAHASCALSGLSIEWALCCTYNAACAWLVLAMIGGAQAVYPAPHIDTLYECHSSCEAL